MVTRLLPLLCLVLLVALPASAADEDLARLLRLEDAEHADHAAAMAWWDERTEAQQLAVLQRGLASDDKDIALVAARALP